METQFKLIKKKKSQTKARMGEARIHEVGVQEHYSTC